MSVSGNFRSAGAGGQGVIEINRESQLIQIFPRGAENDDGFDNNDNDNNDDDNDDHDGDERHGGFSSRCAVLSGLWRPGFQCKARRGGGGSLTYTIEH